MGCDRGLGRAITDGVKTISRADSARDFSNEEGGGHWWQWRDESGRPEMQQRCTHFSPTWQYGGTDQVATSCNAGYCCGGIGIDQVQVQVQVCVGGATITIKHLAAKASELERLLRDSVEQADLRVGRLEDKLEKVAGTATRANAARSPRE
eukprot:SAG22_NODE_2394_length_2621_cov_624.379461_2_plen_151_part_00